jgi:hypothetical protein
MPVAIPRKQVSLAMAWKLLRYAKGKIEEATIQYMSAGRTLTLR